MKLKPAESRDRLRDEKWLRLTAAGVKNACYVFIHTGSLAPELPSFIFLIGPRIKNAPKMNSAIKMIILPFPVISSPF
jgi:hypothetical protein